MVGLYAVEIPPDGPKQRCGSVREGGDEGDELAVLGVW